MNLSFSTFFYSLLRMSGFSSVNTYLLGGLESRWTPATDGIDLPPYGPTLSDVHMADLDRHRSGLHCLGRDHHRLLTGQDLDLTPLQRRQAKVDHLTDSESDEENKYDAPVPSMRRVRALLKGKSLKAVSILAAPENPIAVKKGKAVAKGAKEAKSMVAVSIPVAVPYKDLDDDDSEGEVDESKSEQVELMRDRKTLELESSQSRLRQGQARRHTDRLAILSQASQCLMQALPMQTTFHSCQSIVLTSIERNSVLPLNCFVETYDISK